MKSLGCRKSLERCRALEASRASRKDLQLRERQSWEMGGSMAEIFSTSSMGSSEMGDGITGDARDVNALGCGCSLFLGTFSTKTQRKRIALAIMRTAMIRLA
jgi:hypothetical protein